MNQFSIGKQFVLFSHYLNLSGVLSSAEIINIYFIAISF